MFYRCIDAGKNIQLIRFCGWVNFRRIKARKEEERLIKFKKKQKQEEKKNSFQLTTSDAFQMTAHNK